MDIIIVGAGKLGLRLAELFSQDQNNLTIIDISQERLENVSSYLDVLTILGNGVQLKILNKHKLDEQNYLLQQLVLTK